MLSERLDKCIEDIPTQVAEEQMAFWITQGLLPLFKSDETVQLLIQNLLQILLEQQSQRQMLDNIFPDQPVSDSEVEATTTRDGHTEEHADGDG